MSAEYAGMMWDERTPTLAEVWDDAVRDTFRHSVENPHWTPGDIKDRNPYREWGE